MSLLLKQMRVEQATKAGDAEVWIDCFAASFK